MANTNLNQSIKQQLMVRFQALVTAGAIKSVLELDQNPNPMTINAPAGYPVAVVSFSSVKSDFEDQANNMRTYQYNVLIIAKPAQMQGPEAIEVLMDQVMDQFDIFANLTLANTAVAAVLPITIERVPLSTPDNSLVYFIATINARALFATQ